MSHTEEELKHILAESVEGGHLSRSERIMIENVLNLEEKTARRVMVPRPDIVYLSLARPLEENLRLARQAGHTRFPLCEDDLTTVVGMIHVKDLFRSGNGHNGRIDLRQLARKAPYLPDTLRLDHLLLEFQRNRSTWPCCSTSTAASSAWSPWRTCWRNWSARSRTSSTARRPRSSPLGDGVFEVDASCPLDLLAETVGIEIPETDAETTGGLILDLLGRLAQPGDYVDLSGHRLTVVQADPTRIRKIRIEPLHGDEAALE